MNAWLVDRYVDVNEIAFEELDAKVWQMPWAIAGRRRSDVMRTSSEHIHPMGATEL